MTAEQSSRLLVAFQKINEDIDAEYDGKACVDAHAVLGGASEADASYTYQANVPGHGAPVWCKFKSADLDAASCVTSGAPRPTKRKTRRSRACPRDPPPAPYSTGFRLPARFRRAVPRTCRPKASKSQSESLIPQGLFPTRRPAWLTGSSWTAPLPRRRRPRFLAPRGSKSTPFSVWAWSSIAF